ncbi:hypothetical protein ElyMa_002557900 [Elysia marginata]|uniref:4Fe-4S Wbl-type domain-containing protein n=1 Tax=Elysia marginata TaxID=1093978 RepID=A0AAV4GZV1_9GAST|nr:hypothetical protein ElyMa_002557900 [Elysia marginata]
MALADEKRLCGACWLEVDCLLRATIAKSTNDDFMRPSDAGFLANDVGVALRHMSACPMGGVAGDPVSGSGANFFGNDYVQNSPAEVGPCVLDIAPYRRRTVWWWLSAFLDRRVVVVQSDDKDRGHNGCKQSPDGFHRM